MNAKQNALLIVLALLTILRFSGQMNVVKADDVSNSTPIVRYTNDQTYSLPDYDPTGREWVTQYLADCSAVKDVSPDRYYLLKGLTCNQVFQLVEEGLQ